MDTQPTEAVANDANAPVETAEDIYARIGEETFGVTDDEQEEEQPAEGELTEGAEDDPTGEEEADDLPPIDAPVSWDAEAKEAFKQLPRDVQEIVQKRESERERFVQSKSQEAARARQEAEQAAIQQLAQVQAAYAQQYQQIADSLQVEQPDPMLQVSDPVTYAQQMRAYQQANAQRTHAQQQAQLYAQQAQAQAYQAEQAAHAEQHRIIVDHFPEYADPTTGPELRARLTAVAKELGYPDELIGQARASDILAMRTAADWKAKAEKYDAMQKSKMANVRAARGLPKVAKPGVANTPDQARTRNVAALKETLLTSKNREVQGNAFYELGKSQGWL